MSEENPELNEEQRGQLARQVINILEEWGLNNEQQFVLLGLPEGSKPRHLSRLRQGNPLPNDAHTLDCAKHIIGIHHSLHVVFPLNPKMAPFWLRNRNRALKRPPLAIMIEEGLPGMHRVWRSLDCTLNWED